MVVVVVVVLFHAETIVWEVGRRDEWGRLLKDDKYCVQTLIKEYILEYENAVSVGFFSG